MKRHLRFALGLSLLSLAPTAFAAESATGKVDLQSINGTGPAQTFTYKITLNNTGPSDINSFWYAWLPPDNFYDFLKSKPTATGSPAGWAATLEGLNNGGSDGNSILWTTTTSPLHSGSSLTYTFTTPDNFATVTGASTVSPIGYPTGYSYVYNLGPETDPGALVNLALGSSAAPEPASLTLLAAAASALLLRRRRG